MNVLIDYDWTPGPGSRSRTAMKVGLEMLLEADGDWISREELTSAMATAGEILEKSAGGLLTGACRAGILFRSPGPRLGTSYKHPRQASGAKKFRLNPEAKTLARYHAERVYADPSTPDQGGSP